MPSFDIVSKVDMQEVDNAVNQTVKEIAQRYDFKGSKCEVALEKDAVRVLADDDFRLKPVSLLQRGVDFTMRALEDPEAKVFIHCAAGVHRAPMMTLAVLRAMGWPLEDAIDIIEVQRPVADFAQVYVESVEEFMKSYEDARR